MKLNAVLIASVASFVIGYGGFNLYLFNQFNYLKTDEQATSWYMLFTSFSYALISIALHYATKDKSRIAHALTSTLVCFNVNQSLDEIFFDPCKFQFNEIVLLFLWGVLITKSYYAKHRTVV